MSPLTLRPNTVQKISSLLADLPAKKAQEVGLSRSSAALLKTIVCFANKQDIHAKIHINQHTLCERTGYGRTTVSQAFNQLVELGLIHREQQRKIGRDRWSSPAFCLTEKFVQWLGAMCSVFEHSLSSTKNIKKEIKPAADSAVAVATTNESTLQTKHGLFIKKADGVDMDLVMRVLDSMTKAQALSVLKMASTAGVSLQQAIAYIGNLKTTVKNWYCYIKKSLEQPQDYAAITAKSLEKAKEKADLDFVIQFMQANNKQKVSLFNNVYTIDGTTFYDANANASLFVSKKNATKFAERIRTGQLKLSGTAQVSDKCPPPPPPLVPPQKKNSAAATEAIKSAIALLKFKKGY